MRRRYGFLCQSAETKLFHAIWERIRGPLHRGVLSIMVPSLGSPRSPSKVYSPMNSAVDSVFDNQSNLIDRRRQASQI